MLRPLLVAKFRESAVHLFFSRRLPRDRRWKLLVANKLSHSPFLVLYKKVSESAAKYFGRLITRRVNRNLRSSANDFRGRRGEREREKKKEKKRETEDREWKWYQERGEGAEERSSR